VIVLDTNVVSELMKPFPNAKVIRWVDHQADLAITAVTAAELLYGVNRLPMGERRLRLTAAVADMLDSEFAERVLPFDLAASVEHARIVVLREQAGRTINMADAMIGAVALATDAAFLAARNVKDFDEIGLSIIDPWTAS
jgi:predicted nucleic acid-binding protein